MRKLQKGLLIMLALLLAALPAMAEGTDQLARIRTFGEIIVATEGAWAPWTYHDEDGTLVGFDVEVAQAIAEKLGVAAKFSETEWDGIFAGLDSGRYDIAANGVEVTDERAEKYDFSTPYGYIRTALIVRGDNEDIKSFEDLKGKHTANSIASTYMTLAESYGATAAGVDTLDQTIQMVLSGRADATLNAEVSFYDYMAVHPDANLKVVALTDEASQVAIPVRKGDDSASLLAAINQAIDELRADGTLSRISEKYFGKDITAVPDAAEQTALAIEVNGKTFSAELADTDAARTLAELLKSGALTLDAHENGGFEKVAALNETLPAADEQIAAECGDILLYEGNQIALFYGENSWNYTQLAHISNTEGWAEALGDGDVSITLSLAE